MKFLQIFLFTLFAYTGGANAQDDNLEEDKPLTAEVTLGVLLTSGNTETQSLKGQINVTHDMAIWRNNYVLEGFSKEDQVEYEDDDGNTLTEQQRTAERYFASIQTDFKLNSENRGLFIFGSYEEDHFSGYQYQGTLAAGYSDRLFKTENSRFDYSIGPGMSFTETEEFVADDGTLTESETESTGVLRISTNYLYQISETTKFTQTLASDIALESNRNTKTKAETALTVAINGSLALKAGYTVLYNSEVPEDIEHADTQTSLTLVYSH